MHTAIQLIDVFTWSFLIGLWRVSGSQLRYWAYTTNPHMLQIVSSAVNPGKFNHNALRKNEIVHFKTFEFYRNVTCFVALNEVYVSCIDDTNSA